MNIFFAVIAFVAAVVFPACSMQSVHGSNDSEVMTVDQPVDTEKGAKTPVLVELFTSEGCSSCPPADSLLIELDREQPVDGAEIITLGFHVDYWDSRQWRDRFSSAAFTRRQQEYASHLKSGSTYTPEAVIDGTVEAVGNNDRAVKGGISAGVSVAKALISSQIVADKIRLDISEIPSSKASTVYLAVAENGLNSNVSGGENGGQHLYHVSVVRDLRAVGKIDGGQTNAKFEVAIPTNADWKAANLRYVVFVQENGNMRILGVKKITLK